MANGKRQNALLVEIIIATLFFALSATVILDVFATAYHQSAYAEACNAAMADGQNIAALLYTSDTPEAVLESEGFQPSDGTWRREGEGYILEVEYTVTPGDVGELRTAQVTAWRGEDAILELPCSHYVPWEVAQ